MTEENISAIRARLKFKNLDDFSKGYARYISSGGIFIPMAPERLKPVGALIRFQFLLGDGSTALLGEGRVHQVRAQSSSGKAPIGMLVKFTKLSQTSKKLVEQIVLAKKAATSSEDSSASSEPSEPDPPAPKESEPVQEEEQSLPEQEPAPTTEKPQGEPGIFGLASGHSSLEEETRAGPSPNDITPTKHLAPHNQPSDEPPKADDAPTRDGEQPASAPSEQSAIAPPTNPFEARTVSNSSDDPPTREVEPEDAHRTPTQEQDDPYAIDLFGDIDLGLGTPEDKASAHSSHDLSLFDEPSSPPEEDSSPAPEEEEVDEPSDLDEVEQESSEEDTPEDDEQVFSQEPSDDTPAKDDAL